MTFVYIMKKIIIKIKELGPIRDAEIELAPFMLFTGISNLGKSYTNFLAYYVFTVFANNRMHQFIANKMEGKLKQKEEFDFSFTINELCIWMMKDVKVFFQNLLKYPNIPCDIIFNLGLESIKYDIHFKKTKDLLIGNDQTLSLAIVTINGEDRPFICTSNKTTILASSNISHKMSKDIFGHELYRSFLLPPGRASLLDNGYTVQSEAGRIGMYNIFLRDYDLLMDKGMDESKRRNDQQFFNSRIQKLINGKLLKTQDGISLELTNGRTVPISAAASSIKELSPILFWMQNRIINNDSICIEEPEAHAHPEMQQNIADLLVACANKGAFMQITTHSDYLLSRFNQLIKLNQLKKNNVDGFIDFCKSNDHSTNLTLDPDIIKAYYFFIDENNNIRIKKQNLNNGIPLDSFSNIVLKQIETDNSLEELEEKGNYEK